MYEFFEGRAAWAMGIAQNAAPYSDNRLRSEWVAGWISASRDYAPAA
jgi:ribosome modulation factor